VMASSKYCCPGSPMSNVGWFISSVSFAPCLFQRVGGCFAQMGAEWLWCVASARSPKRCTSFAILLVRFWGFDLHGYFGLPPLKSPRKLLRIPLKLPPNRVFKHQFLCLAKREKQKRESRANPLRYYSFLFCFLFLLSFLTVLF
jgi:hypothetical protein